jgi:hypothetical protein
MRALWLVTPALTVLLGSVAATMTPAYAAGTGIAGAYAYSQAESENVDKAIESALASANFVVRTVARGRLEKTNKPYTKVAISTSGSSLSIQTDGRPPIVLPASGATIAWTRPEDGEKLQVSAHMVGTKLEETFAAPDGKRVNVFEPSADGSKLYMTVTVSSGKLPKPVTYRLAYKRTK